MEETLLTTREAAAYIGMSYQWLRKAIADDTIVPTVKGSQGDNTHLFSKSDLKGLVKPVIRPNAFQEGIPTLYNNREVVAVEKVESYIYRLTYADGSTEDVKHTATLVRKI